MPARVQNQAMAAADHLSYPARAAWRDPEMVLLNTAVSMLYASFGVLAVVLIVAGTVYGSPGIVVFGILVAVAIGYITWNGLHTPSRLEFSNGRLSWWSSLPWSPRMRPGRVRAIRWPISPRGRYVQIELDDGRKVSVLPRPGVMEFINSVHDVEPTIAVDVRPDWRKNKWMSASAEPTGYIQRRLRAVVNHRSFRIAYSVVVSLLVLGVVAELGLGLIGPQENFQTLRSDLAKVHLPSGYRLVNSHQEGHCAHKRCSLTQTWTWVPTNERTKTAICSEVRHAMISAFSDVQSNSPVPANASCDYFTELSNLLHPGQGERMVEAIVQTDGLKLIALYG
jgi:hypothetical protein